MSAAMMSPEEVIFVGMDVGTTKVCALVGHLNEEGQVRVIGVGIAPSQGMRKGGVVSLEGVARAVEAAKDKAERSSGYEITSALVSLSGAQIASLNSKGMAGVSGRIIGTDDVARALDAARSIALPYNRQVIHVIPRGYVVDGQDGIKSPLGMHGFRLEVEAHIVTAASTALRNMEKAFEAAGLAIDGWVLGPLASAEVVLTETEREMGVVLCDIGGGTCDMAVYIEGAVWHTAVIPVGGDHLTSDIAQGLHLPHETAETVKQRHGHARVSAIDPNEMIAVRPFGQDKSVQYRRTDLAAVIEPRVEELFGLARQEIKRSGYDGLLPAGMVLTGGTSLLPGIRDVASDVLRLPVRVGEAEQLQGLVDQLRSPSFSASLGLLEWARLQDEQSRLDGRGLAGFSIPKLDLARAADFFKRLLPG
ncbi:MAG: cell division protein FtsA [Gammaproteobacteria bacterium RBG_16_66_13]|nr:MAG: cell division protein FtsA [Gammaproteobacteria bacterium RBG_16_66_13]